MALDPSIPLQSKGFQLESPMAQASSVLGILNLIEQQKARQMQMQQAAQMNPLQIKLLEAQIANQQAQGPIREAQAAKTLWDLAQDKKKAQAQDALSAELAKPDEATALEAVRQAEARGEPANITARNPNLVQSLFAKVAPQQAATAVLRQPPGGLSTALSKLIQERSALPPGDPRIRIYDDAIAKASTHQAPVNVYSGSLTAGVDAQGRPVFVQPSGRPDVPPRVVPDVFPAPKPADKTQEKERQKEAEAEQTVESVRARIRSLSQLVQQNPTAVGLTGMVRRGGETLAGVAESLGGPSVPTPALDFQNQQALLLADVRKLVEKDPNLSNQERETLKQTLGSGMMQTPSSSIRAMNNVLEYVERKKLTGVSRERAIEKRAPPVGTVQGGYRFKGGDPAQQENWERVP